ncbi:hypothetical protein SAMN06269301_2139 [Geobacter sp. DSM 9736]|nr:hypothetical protein SAMN06269301_2139 [Geobacter sp. DSM 9736]
MLVMVRYMDDEYGIVEDYCLDYLIATGKIAEFARSDEWVTIGCDRVRGSGGVYDGPERRKPFSVVTGDSGEA